MLWLAFWLTIAGTALTVAAAAWAFGNALATRKRLRNDFDWIDRRLIELREASQAEPSRTEQLSEEWAAAFAGRFGHSPFGRYGLHDMPIERATLVLAENQIRDLRGPAGLVLLGVLTSCAGSLASLWA